MPGISSILSLLGSSSKELPARPSLTPLDGPAGERKYFQYWPEDIKVNKQINWDAKNIPALSHPIYQWISGGSREISFTAIFTRDRALTAVEKQQISAIGTGLGKSFSDPRNIDIPSAVNWLESYLYPEVSNGKPFRPANSRPLPPRKGLLNIPGMRLRRGSIGNVDDVPVIMLSAPQVYQGFFSDGTPRIVKVDLQFAEITQFSGGVVEIQDAADLRLIGNSGYRYNGGGK